MAEDHGMYRGYIPTDISSDVRGTVCILNRASRRAITCVQYSKS